MLTKDCKNCKHCLWMVAIGFGVRCSHKENQKYISSTEKYKDAPVIISYVPTGCEFKDERKVNPTKK